MAMSLYFSRITRHFCMENVVSKSKFKSRALEYFREVEKTGQPIIITERMIHLLTSMHFGMSFYESGIEFIMLWISNFYGSKIGMIRIEKKVMFFFSYRAGDFQN